MSEPTEQKEMLFQEIEPHELATVLEQTIYNYTQLSMNHADECELKDVANHIHKLTLLKQYFLQL